MFQTNHLYLDQAVKAHQTHVQQEAKLARFEPLFAAKLLGWFKPKQQRPQAQPHYPQPT